MSSCTVHPDIQPSSSVRSQNQARASTTPLFVGTYCEELIYFVVCSAVEEQVEWFAEFFINIFFELTNLKSH